MSTDAEGTVTAMRIGNTEVRPLGGAWGCLAMIVISLLLSVFCTIGLNILVR